MNNDTKRRGEKSQTTHPVDEFIGGECIPSHPKMPPQKRAQAAPQVDNFLPDGDWLKVLQTTDRSQIALLRLKPGPTNGAEQSIHHESDQVLLVVSGEIAAEIGGKQTILAKGDSVTVLAGTPYRFTNNNQEPAVAFNVYASPAYPAAAM